MDSVPFLAPQGLAFIQKQYMSLMETNLFLLPLPIKDRPRVQRCVWYINESLLAPNSAKINSALPDLKKKGIVKERFSIFFCSEYYLLAICFAELAKTEAQCLCFWDFDYFGCQGNWCMVLFLIGLCFFFFTFSMYNLTQISVHKF